MDSGTVEKAVRDLSVFVLMLEPSDAMGFEIALDLVQALKTASEVDPKFAQLQSTAEELLEKLRGASYDEQQRLLSAFASYATEYLRDPAAALSPFSLPPTPQPRELRTDLDMDLVHDFIDKSLGDLEEFEATLLGAMNDLKNGVAPGANLSSSIKAFLHNLKGEAATVGCTGLERVAHAIEDILVGRDIAELLELLLRFKEWAVSFIKAVSDSKPPPSSQDFLTLLNRGKNGATVSQPESTGTAPSLSNASCPGDTHTVHGPYRLSGELDIINDFIVEAEDHLSAIEEILLDRDVIERSDLDAIFRAAHSLKGGSAYFSVVEMTKSSHIAESMLDQVRNGEIPFTQTIRELILRYIDVQRELLASVKHAIANDFTLHPHPSVQLLMNDITHVVASTATPSAEAALPISQNTEGSPEQRRTFSTSGSTSAPPMEIDGTAAASNSQQKSEKRDVKTFVKVDTTRLDKLIEYIGEMVISSSMLIRSCEELLGANEQVRRNTHQLDQIVREIQDIGMSMRLVPIKGLFQKMSRVVWDTAKKLGKEVTFKLEGEETELDRTLIDRLADPLMHMVRNAVDHGIEHPEERAAARKSRTGTVRLSAYHRGGNIYIEVADDGKGLDAEKLVKKAVDRGILNPNQQLSPQEAYQLIMAPGFSTAEVVTDVSGRGVGMDVVKQNISAMRGRILIDSQVGQGSTFRIELPLTLAIMDGIETIVGSQHFIFPTYSVVEFVTPHPTLISRTLGRGDTLNFRGSFIPIFRLAQVFDIPDAKHDVMTGTLIIVDCNGEVVALLVDDIVGKISAVVKSLGVLFKDIPGLTGCAILPSGSVGLIVDIPTLLQFARGADILQRDSLTHSCSVVPQIL